MPRAVDILIVALLAPLVFPLCVILCALVAFDVGRPIFFRQLRPGFKGSIFAIYKFRTMTDACDGAGVPLPDGQRLTRFGKLMRATSLDELPSLLNLVRGEIRLVGPRPLLVEYLELYTSEQMRRHDVPPGITGWAQVMGRNKLTWDEKFSLDLWYVDNRSFSLDVKILVLTIWRVISRNGISADGEVTMSRFKGSGELK
ncbi:MAG: sugar transferase [Sphingomonadaceae bacterium PASS1]|nr:MAG: sugar transferase [Sphingomonadaceae bacterium PASS1]